MSPPIRTQASELPMPGGATGSAVRRGTAVEDGEFSAVLTTRIGETTEIAAGDGEALPPTGGELPLSAPGGETSMPDGWPAEAPLPIAPAAGPGPSRDGAVSGLPLRAESAADPAGEAIPPATPAGGPPRPAAGLPSAIAQLVPADPAASSVAGRLVSAAGLVGAPLPAGQAALAEGSQLMPPAGNPAATPAAAESDVPAGKRAPPASAAAREAAVRAGQPLLAADAGRPPGNSPADGPAGVDGPLATRVGATYLPASRAATPAVVRSPDTLAEPEKRAGDPAMREVHEIRGTAVDAANGVTRGHVRPEAPGEGHARAAPVPPAAGRDHPVPPPSGARVYADEVPPGAADPNASRSPSGTPGVQDDRGRAGVSNETATPKVREAPLPNVASVDAGSLAAGTSRAAADPAAAVPRQPAAPAIALPVQQPGWDVAMSDRVLMMAGGSIRNAEVRLTPTDLGPLRIRLTIDDATANVSFQAQHAVTRDAIEQALPRLREMLAENGLSLGQADVRGEDPRREARDDAPGTGSAGLSVPADAGFENPRPPAVRSADGLVDTFA